MSPQDNKEEDKKYYITAGKANWDDRQTRRAYLGRSLAEYAGKTDSLNDVMRKNAFRLTKGASGWGAAGVGAGLGAYYLHKNLKNWDDPNKAPTRESMAKDAGKVALATGAAYAAGRLGAHLGVKRGNKFARVVDGETSLPIDMFDRASREVATHGKLGSALGVGAVGAGIGGYLLYKHLKDRRKKRDEQKRKAQEISNQK